jgi:hypothetical protein
MDKTLEGDGLRDIRVRAQFVTPAYVLLGVRSREDDGGNVAERRVRLDFAERFAAIQFRHVEIEQ